MIRDNAAKLKPAVLHMLATSNNNKPRRTELLTKSLSKRKGTISSRFKKKKLREPTGVAEIIFSQQQTACNILRHAHSRMLLLLLRVYPAGSACFDVAEGLPRRRQWDIGRGLRPASSSR